MDTVILSLLQKVQFLSEIESPRIFAHHPDELRIEFPFLSFEQLSYCAGVLSLPR